MRSLLLSSLALLPALALAQPDASSFPSCLAGLQKKAQAQGISADSYERFTSGLQADLSVLDLLDAQPEFTTPLWDYLAGLVDEQRVSDGKAMLAQHDKLLDQVAARYGVDKYTVVAVWGVESDYGRIFGKRPLLTSLSTLSCYGRRQSFFQGEFLATLKLLQAGDIRDAGITGSWAGAFGHTQFMPSTYARIAVDFDGDGRRDLVGSVPDALGSTANYLKKAGWRTGQPWGYEVKVPADFPASLAGRRREGRDSPADRGPGPGLPGLSQLRCDLFLQRRGKLRAGHCPAFRPPARRQRPGGVLADRRPGHQPARAQAIAEGVAGARLRHRRGRRADRHQHAQGDPGRAEAPRPDPGRRSRRAQDPRGAEGRPALIP